MGFCWEGIQKTFASLPVFPVCLEIKFLFLAFLVWQILGFGGNSFCTIFPPVFGFPVWFHRLFVASHLSSPANRGCADVCTHLGERVLLSGEDPKMLRWSLHGLSFLIFSNFKQTAVQGIGTAVQTLSILSVDTNVWNTFNHHWNQQWLLYFALSNSK